MGKPPRKAPAWRRYLRFWRADPAADVDAELQFHLDSRIDELTQQGVAPADARRAALTEFGDYRSIRHEVEMLFRTMRGLGLYRAASDSVGSLSPAVRAILES